MARPFCLATTLTLMLLGNGLALGDEGHPHGIASPRPPSDEAERFPPPPLHPLRNNQRSTGCSTGSCCSGATGCSISPNAINGNGQALRPDNFFLTSTAPSGPDEFVRLASWLSETLDYEMRGTRYYSNLRDDADYVLRTSRRLREADVARASADQLLADARQMFAPLRRMSREFSNDHAAVNSYQLTQDLGQMLDSWARGVQSGSAVRVQPPSPESDSFRSPRPPIPPRNQDVSIPEEMKGVALLPADEQAAALRQRTCPVTKQPLGSMGRPIRVRAAGRSVFVCCEGCVDAVKSNPDEYLS